MPTARKTTGRKTTTSRPETAAEKELKDFRAKVVNEIVEYRRNGDLCNDEYFALRQRLGLQELPSPSTFKVEIVGDIVIDGGDPSTISEMRLAEVLAEKVRDFLKAGVTIENFRNRPTSSLGVPEPAQTLKINLLDNDNLELDDYEFSFTSRF